MSYRTWHEYGYGIIVDDIKNTTVDKVFELVHKAPNFEKDFLDWIQNSYGEDGVTASEIVTLENILEYESDSCYTGLGPILSNVIKEAEGIDFYVCDDYDCKQYLIYLPSYPWYMRDNEVNLKEEDIVNILQKYISIITDDPIDIDYQECENGG